MIRRRVVLKLIFKLGYEIFRDSEGFLNHLQLILQNVSLKFVRYNLYVFFFNSCNNSVKFTSTEDNDIENAYIQNIFNF